MCYRKKRIGLLFLLVEGKFMLNLRQLYTMFTIPCRVVVTFLKHMLYVWVEVHRIPWIKQIQQYFLARCMYYQCIERLQQLLVVIEQKGRKYNLVNSHIVRFNISIRMNMKKKITFPIMQLSVLTILYLNEQKLCGKPEEN